MNNRAAPVSPVVLALDIGTSSVRAALFDQQAREILQSQARIVRSLRTTLEGGAELEAEAAFEQVAHTLDAALSQSVNLAHRIETVAVSCFWHSMVGVDEAGRAVTPVFGWADTRAARAAQTLRRHLNEQELHTRTGSRLHASYWPAKLLWLQLDHPDIYQRVARWLSFSEFLFQRLFGETAISVSMASGTGLLNLRSCQWDAELLAHLNLHTAQLPSIAVSNKIFSGLADEYARRWPQLKDALWLPAIGDGAANNIGAGCLTLEHAALMIGTSGAMRVLWEGGPPASLAPALWCYRADRERVLVGGALSDGGGLHAWISDAFNLCGNHVEIESALAEMLPDSHGLTIMPFWAGERSTGWSAAARGAILGLTMHTRPIEILRAAMEAIAYRFALIADALKEFAPGLSIKASGGALLSSPVWAQIIADVLGRPLTLSAVPEASSRGAVLLALETTGKINNLADAPAPTGNTYEPDMARHARYRRGLERQQEIYRRLIADQETARTISEAIMDTAPDDESKEGFDSTPRHKGSRPL